MDRELAMEIGRVIRKVIAINWQDKEGCWVNHMRVRVKDDISKPLRKVVFVVG